MDSIKRRESVAMKSSEVPNYQSNTTLVTRDCKVYKRRWLMVFIFVLYSMSNAIQWIQYTTIGDVVSKFYGVDYNWVEWTSIVFMVSYVLLILPGSWALEKFGLKKCILLGSLSNCLGAWIKMFSAKPTGFAITFTGQTIAAMSQVFVLSLPPRLAAVWFGSEEVSTACGIGVLGNQIGITIGFLLPPLIVKYSNDIAIVASNFKMMYSIVAGLASVAFIMVVFMFEDQPPLPPSQAALKQQEAPPTDFFLSMRRLVTNVGYDMLLLSFGINVGVFGAISTLLNKLIILHFPNAQEDVGRIGVLACVSGILGSVAFGYVLDKTKRFKETTLIVYICSSLSLVVCIICIESPYKLAIYAAGALVGFFMTGYIPVGFEFASELTYPEPEGTSVGLLNGICQIFGILMTLAYSSLIDNIGTLKAGLVISCSLVLGTILTGFIPKNYRRQIGNLNKEGDPA